MSKWLVRTAKPSDCEWIVEQAKHFIDYLQLQFEANEPHLRQVIAEFVTKHVVVLVEKDGVRCGIAAALLQPHVFNPNVRTLTEVMWWVVPEYRNTRAGLLLLDTLDDIGNKTADLVVMSVEAHSSVNERTLVKRGYKKQELAFVKAVRKE